MEGRKQGELMSSQELKKMIPQLLLSLSLFSFLFSYSTLYSSSSLLHSSKFHSFHFLDKNCLFLICNGLLVFLAKTSGFIRPPSHPHDLDHHTLHKSIIGDVDECHITEHLKQEEEEMEKSESPEEVAIFIAESEEEGGGCDDVDRDDQDDPQVAGQSRRCWLFNDDDEDEVVVNDDEKEEMSTEELNQKFEEFIRRMKKEIVINEATNKSLVLVN